MRFHKRFIPSKKENRFLKSSIFFCQTNLFILQIGSHDALGLAMPALTPGGRLKNNACTDDVTVGGEILATCRRTRRNADLKRSQAIYPQAVALAQQFVHNSGECRQDCQHVRFLYMSLRLNEPGNVVQRTSGILNDTSIPLSLVKKMFAIVLI